MCDYKLSHLQLTDEELLKKYDWVIECESPFEVRYSDGGAFASGCAADAVVSDIRSEIMLTYVNLLVDAYNNDLIDKNKLASKVLDLFQKENN